MVKLSFKNVALGYDGKASVENLNFSVNSGDYVFITGENGSGKTTLIKSILNLNSPIKGKITVNAEKIGYLPQQTDIQSDFPASVKEIVFSGVSKNNLRPFYTKKEKELFYSSVKRLGIEDILSRSFSELSGGQKQKVLLARALCAAKDLLLLDEPVSGLDPQASQELYKILEEINKSGITILMISHDINAVKKYADYVLNIRETGHLLTIEEYLKGEIR